MDRLDSATKRRVWHGDRKTPASCGNPSGQVTTSPDPLESELSRFEKLAVGLARETNEHKLTKALQTSWLRGVSYGWVRPAIGRRLIIDGLAELATLRPDRGVLFVANHRSFFDQYCIMLACFGARIPFVERLYFPVRANFFYERPLGVLVNYFMSGGAMYPPIFRQKERRELNDDALERSVRFLGEPGTVVGVHPEGTRGKGPDPYQFLPAQPGVGKIALLANTMIVPWFINGLGNDIIDDVRVNFRRDVRHTRPVTAVVGSPIDISDLAAQKPRPTLYKKTADRLMQAVGILAEREKPLRAACLAGQISDDDPRWLTSWNPPKF
jgi:1-acyl-sn-glycerol-3-phosphate acyltransferase